MQIARLYKHPPPCCILVLSSMPPAAPHAVLPRCAGGRPGGAPIVGTCSEMCPAEERALRERTQTVRLFERPDPRNAGRTTAALAVKSFARTGVRTLCL